MNLNLTRIKSFLFQNKSAKQTILKNTVWLTGSQIIGRVFRASILIYAARVLGAAEYGVFSYALGLAAFFTIFADIGLNSITTREASKQPHLRSNFFSTGFWIKSILIIFTVSLVIFVAPYFSKIEAAKALMPLIALLVIFDGLRDFSNAFFRAEEKMEKEALVMLITNMGIALAGFAILFFSQTAGALAWSYVSSAGAGALVAVIILKKEFFNIVTNFRKEFVRPMVKASLPIAFVSVLGVFTLNVDVIMLGWWRSAEEVGFYSAAQRIVVLLYLIPGILANALFPQISKAVGENNKEKSSYILEYGLTAIFLFALPITLGGFIVGGELINLIYGQEYTPAIPAFKTLIWTILAVFPATILPSYLLAHNAQNKVGVGIAIGSILDIALNAFLIPRYGIWGASISTVATQFFIYAYVQYVAQKVNHFNVINRLWKIFFAVSLMGISTLLLQYLGVNVIINILTSGALYMGTLLILKERVFQEVISLIKK